MSEEDEGTPVESPVTGSVWKVATAEGETVAVGDLIMIVESMKTEIQVLATESGRLSRLLAGTGTPVQAGQAVALIESR